MKDQSMGDVVRSAERKVIDSVREKQQKIGMATVLMLTLYLVTGNRYVLALMLAGIGTFLIIEFAIWAVKLQNKRSLR